MTCKDCRWWDSEVDSRHGWGECDNWDLKMAHLDIHPVYDEFVTRETFGCIFVELQTAKTIRTIETKGNGDDGE